MPDPLIEVDRAISELRRGTVVRVYDTKSSFLTLAVDALTPDSINVLTQSCTTLPKLLFYYGDNKKPNKLLTSVNYYLFNEDNPNNVGTDLQTILANLNNLLKYDFTINEFFINALPDNNILALTGDTTDGKSVDVIKLSAMHELIFMEFIVKLNNDKNIHIEALKISF